MFFAKYRHRLTGDQYRLSTWKKSFKCRVSMSTGINQYREQQKSKFATRKGKGGNTITHEKTVVVNVAHARAVAHTAVERA